MLCDKKGKTIEIKPYQELKDGDFDPIEIYAYYLGLYINNMNNGIYMHYVLSFPVNYELAVRDKLLKSFERGLKKALPSALLKDEAVMKNFKIYAGASEPAAYAISALQEFKLQPQDTGGSVCYGVFDFGGGTTDFDFGIEEIPEEYLVQIGDNYYTTYTTYAKRDWSGSAIPKVYGSISTSLQWKNLAFSALFTYSLGGKIYDYSYASLMGMTSNPSAAHKDILNSWKGIPEGMTEDSPNRIDPNGTPIINYELSSRNNAQSTRFLTNASYLVIKNLTLSYDFPKSLIQKIDLKSLRLNASVENLATFTHRKGMNPQQNFSGTSSDVLVTPRVFTIGLNVTF